MTELEEIDHWMQLQSPLVRKNAKIVTPEDLGIKHLFRIDKEVQKVYIPRLPYTAAKDEVIENASTPRICMGRSLMGCVIGYNRWKDDIYNSMGKSTTKVTGYHGGYIVQTIPFNYAITINKKLLWESEATGEVWLVAYNKATATYKSTAIGKLFCTSLEIAPRAKSDPLMVAEFYLEHDYAEGLPFLDEGEAKPKGFYRIKAKFDNLGVSSMVGCNAKDKEIYEFTEVSEAEYNEFKSLTASLLSLGKPPVPLNW